MEQHNCLGIYLSSDWATAVLLAGGGAKAAVRQCFSIAIDSSGEQSLSIASMLAQNLVSRKINFADISIALDCALFTQHNIRSEFTDKKQIAQTIAFDIEEVAAIDAENLALSFNVTDTDEHGSQLAVFTADRQFLGDMLTDLQQNNLDPVAIEPDIICLARFLQHNRTAAGDHPLFVIFSKKSCYLITPSQSQQAPTVRSFLVGPSQNKTDLLASQIPLTIASQTSDEPITSIVIATDDNELDIDSLTQRTGIAIETVDISQTANGEPESIADCGDPVDFAIAYGAALAEIKKSEKCDFRRHFSPYQGKKLAMQNTLRVISISVTILMLALGIHFQLKVFKKKNYISGLNQKLNKQYAEVMFGQKPPERETIDSRLGRELTSIKNKQAGGGLGDDDSITSRLTLIMSAINDTPKKIDLKISTINLIQKNTAITGNTASERTSRKNILDFIKILEKHKLKVSPRKNIRTIAGRDIFTINIEPNKKARTKK